MKITKNILLKKLRNEILEKQNPVDNTAAIKLWYKRIVKNSNVKVKSIPLNKCKNWSQKKNGSIIHSSGKFFKVEGIRVIKSFNRELNKTWDQPIITEPGYNGGILGLIRKKIKNFPHYLINAKFEPGNYNLIQLSPTVQATFSNIKKAHGGRDVKFINFFKYPKKNHCQIIFKQWVSEEGGRLRNKRNLAMIVNYQGDKDLDISSDYKWVTLKQIKELILEDAIVNPHLRTLVSFI